MKRYFILCLVLFSLINVQCAAAYQEGLIKLTYYGDYIFHVTNTGNIYDPLGSFKLYDWPNTTDAYGNVCTSPTVAYNPSTYKSFCTYDYVLTQTVFDFSSGISLPITINGRTFTDVITDTYTGTDQFAAVYGWKYLTLWFYDRADNPTITTSSAANHSVIVKGQGMSCKLNPGYTTNNSLANCVTYSYGTTSISINNVGILNAKSSQDMYYAGSIYFPANVVSGVPGLTVTLDPQTGGGTVVGAGINCNGTPGANDCYENYVISHDVELTASPDAGHEFLYWDDGCTQIPENRHIFTVDGPKNVTAKFVQTLTVTVDTDKAKGSVSSGETPPVIQCDDQTNMCAHTYYWDAEVNLTATPKPGYQFVGWKENDQIISTEKTLPAFLVEETRNLVAVFEATQSHLPVRPTNGEIALDYDVDVSWRDANHNGIDYDSALGAEIKSVGKGKVYEYGNYTKVYSSSFGAIGPDKDGPTIWIEYKLSSGEPIYVLYGHTASSWNDQSAGSGINFVFSCTYVIDLQEDAIVEAGDAIGYTAPFYHSGDSQPHLHLSVFKPNQQADGTYYGPPNSGWGYSAMSLPTGDYIDPEVFFSNYQLTDDI